MASKQILRLLRFVFRIPRPRISVDDALAIALTECDKRGWVLRDPVVIEYLRTWEVTGHVKGGPWITIDQQTGRIVRRECAPR